MEKKDIIIHSPKTVHVNGNTNLAFLRSLFLPFFLKDNLTDFFNLNIEVSLSEMGLILNH